MKKSLYFLLLAAEALLGLLLMGQLYSWFGWPVCLVTAAALALLLIALLRRLRRQKKQGDEPGQKKTLRRIALAMLLPTAVALPFIILTLISLMLYFG